jgi:hypothetical protein
MLESTGNFIEVDDIVAACLQLCATYNRGDGKSNPPDFFDESRSLGFGRPD